MEMNEPQGLELPGSKITFERWEFLHNCLDTLLGTSISLQKSLFEDDLPYLPFPKVGYVSSLEGIH